MTTIQPIQPRWFHAATLVNTMVYITGGTTRDHQGKLLSLDETLMLDLTQSWSIDNPLFKILDTARLPIPLSGHSMNKIQGTSQLVIVGGESINNSRNTTKSNKNSTDPMNSSILLVDTKHANTTGWSTLLLQYPSNSSNSNNTNNDNDNSNNNSNNNNNNSTGSTMPSPIHRMYHATTSTRKDGILVQGGYQSLIGNNNRTIVSSLVTLKPNFDKSSISQTTTAIISLARNAPALARHTMTLTPDGRAIILGGINSQGILTNLTQAYVLDTQADATTAEWKVVPLFGQPPAPRMEFTAVMVNATTMLVYGGTSDFKSANWATFYLDLPTWTWTSPMAQGITPRRWGHTATMAGNVMVVAFGLSSRQSPGNTTVVLLDTRTNTWITQFDPQVMNIGTGNSGNDDSDNNDDDSGVQDVDGEGKGPMSVGMVLGLGFVVTLAIVGGVFWLLVRKRKRRTRNQRAKENIDQFTTSRSVAGAISSSSANHRNGAKGFFEAFSLGTISNNQSRTERDGRGRKRRDSKRYSTTSVRTQHPQSILERMAELGYSPLQFGYPESVIRQGSGGVTVSNYIYPNQPCTQIEKVVTCGGNDGDRNRNEVETQVVFHDLSSAQKEALRLEFEQRQRQGGHDQAPKHELLQSNVEEYV